MLKERRADSIENLLRKLFNYQRFEKEKSLQTIINNVHHRYDHATISLTETDLSFVAGGRNIEDKKDEEDFGKKQD